MPNHTEMRLSVEDEITLVERILQAFRGHVGSGPFLYADEVVAFLERDHWPLIADARRMFGPNHGAELLKIYEEAQ